MNDRPTSRAKMSASQRRKIYFAQEHINTGFKYADTNFYEDTLAAPRVSGESFGKTNVAEHFAMVPDARLIELVR